MPDSNDAPDQTPTPDAADSSADSRDQPRPSAAAQGLEQALMSAVAKPTPPAPQAPVHQEPSQEVPDSLRPPDVIITDTRTDKGYGVYAARPYKQGEVVEIAPVLMFEEKFRDLQRCLQERVFDWGTLAKTRRSNCLPLGCGCLYNHHEPSNLATSAIDTEKLQALRFTAVRDIEPGEELTINYNAHGGGHTWHDDNWFKQLQIDPVKIAPPLEGSEESADDADEADDAP